MKRDIDSWKIRIFVQMHPENLFSQDENVTVLLQASGLQLAVL